MTLRAIVAAAIGLCVASLAYIATSVRAPAPLSPNSSGHAELPRMVPLVSAPMAALGTHGRDAATPWSPHDSASLVAQRWHSASDKREFYDQALRTGSGAYLHFAGKALAACGAVNRLGMIGAEQRFGATHRANDPTLTRRIEAFRASIAGCDGFEERPVSADEEAAILQRLVASGDLLGRIYKFKLWAPTAARGDDARATLVQALDARDPEILALVHQAIVAREFAQRPLSANGGDDMQDELDAWRWALCELGSDCAPRSAYGLALCSSRGLCDWSSVDEVAAKLYPGATAKRKDEIVARVRAGDWSKLGL